MTINERIARAKADYDAVFEAGKKSVLSVLDFTDAESNTYRITVPSGADDFARVNKIGGMTHKTRNLIPFPYQYQGEQTLNGVTWNFTENGITASGTQETSSSVTIYIFSSPITLNGTYTASINKAFPSNSALYLTFDDNLGNVEFLRQGNTVSTTTINNRKCTSIRLWITNGATFNGENYLFMLNEGSTALPYEPYFEGLRNAEVTELKSEGANIANLLYGKNDWVISSGNGTVISATENSIECQGKVGSTPYYPYASNGWLVQREASVKLSPFKKGDRISLSYDFEILELPSDYTNSTISVGCGFGFIQNSSLSLWKTSNINFSLGIQRVSATFDVTDTEASLTPVIRISLSSLHAKVSNIMINYGDVTSYKPYREGAIDTLPISEAIKSLDGYGLGKNADEYNYIDFGNKIFKQDYAKVRLPSNKGTFNADSKWYYISKTELGISPLSREILCNLLPSADITANSTISGIYMSASPMNFVLIRKTEFTTEAEYKQWLADNEVYIIERLAEPIETDISAYLTDEYIEVEGGGTITAVNEYGYDAPTNISYLLDTQGG